MEEKKVSNEKESQDRRENLENILLNYRNMEADIVNHLTYKCKHGSVQGSGREEIWKELFEQIIPQKFKVAQSVFVIDSTGHCSKEVDLAIYDEQYTPYIFRYKRIKFIPIEAVAAVVECKSESKNSEQLTEWVDSIEQLKTAKNAIVRIESRIIFSEDEEKDKKPTQTATRPLKLLCHTNLEGRISLEGTDISKAKSKFDIVIEAFKGKTKDKNKAEEQEEALAEERKERLNISFNIQPNSGNTQKTENTQNTLYYWYYRLNHAQSNWTITEREGKREIVTEERLKETRLDSANHYVVQNEKNKQQESLLSFIFQFNQLLMLINNPLFFPHREYVKLFNTYLSEEGNQEEENNNQ